MSVGSISVRGTSAPESAEPSASRREQARRVEGYGPIAGILFLAGSLVSVPGSLLIQPPPETYLLIALVALTGLVCLALPWERISPLWLHALGAVATLEVGACVAFIDYAYGFYFVVIAALVAHGARNRLETAAHLTLIAATLLMPIAWEPENARAIVREALLIVPSIVIAAGVVVYLRERLETKQRMYRRFAEEAFELTWRIRGIPVPEGVAEPAPLGSLIRRPPRLRARMPAFGWLRGPALAASLLLVFPLGTTSLAAAGVSLPGIVVDPLERLGVTLPNQPASDQPASDSSARRAVDASAGGVTGDGERGGSSSTSEVAVGTARPADSPAPSGGTVGGAPYPGDAPAGSAPSYDPPDTPSLPEPGDVVRRPGSEIDLTATLDRTLRETTATLDRLLSNLGLPLLKRR